ncbi:MAG: lysophospholipid acyltransferase family protein [Phycisphaeraceae bacterium]|nr:lysophospholipid acyltransferase family protein [Phycisphaeraceae bacterium]
MTRDTVSHGSRDDATVWRGRPMTQPLMMSGNQTKRTNPIRAIKRLTSASAIALAGAAVVYLIGTTMTVSAPRLRDLKVLLGEDHKTGVLFALWHGTHFPVLWHYRHSGFGVITSQSRDGEVLTGILHHLGCRCYRGSSSKGGTRALLETAKAVQGGVNLAVAVDGPRGPRGQVKSGILSIAKLSGAPIVPVACGLSHCQQFNSWDRYRLPLPLCHATIIVDEPFYVPPDTDDGQLESIRVSLETSLNALQVRADDLAAQTG